MAQTRLWLLPLTCVLAGIGLAVALLSVDLSSGFRIVSAAVTGLARVGADDLSVASTALVTLTRVVLSLTLVAGLFAGCERASASLVRSVQVSRPGQWRFESPLLARQAQGFSALTPRGSSA